MASVTRSTWRDALSVSLTVGLYGAAFGAASVAAGFSVLQTSLLSLLTFTGASQFAAVGVISAGGGALSAIATAGLLSSRNALYGLQMTPHLAVRGWRRVLAAQWTIDESTNVGLAQRHHGPEAVRAGFWITGAGVYLFWNLFTLAGALGAKSIGNPAAWGLDAAVPAAFLGLLWPRLTDRFTQLVAAGAMVFALAATPVLPSGTAIIATVVVAIGVGWRDRS
jgi:predicted branched-subunit amino acid permease